MSPDVSQTVQFLMLRQLYDTHGEHDWILAHFESNDVRLEFRQSVTVAR